MARPKIENVTIKDVARESGVNISTVSRSLSGSYGVHPTTRERVLDAARRLKYRPNRVARGLATGRSNTIGLVISDIRNPYFAEVARGAEDAAHKAGCDLVLCNSDLDPDKQMRYVHSLVEKRVDGLIMNSVATLNDEQQRQLVDANLPVVLLNRPGTGVPFSTVAADNYAGGRLAAAHLLELGHTAIGHAGGPKRHRNLAERAAGFLSALEEDGRVTPAVIYGDPSFIGGHEMGRQLVSDHPEVTAIFAGNDVIALGVIRAVMEAGKRVPEDVSIIGFDDIELASLLQPPLTTIRQPKHEMGRIAVEILLRHRGSEVDAPAENHVLQVVLIKRESCAPARAAAQTASQTSR